MVGVRGFEPPAPASRRQCSTRLSYTPTTDTDCMRKADYREMENRKTLLETETPDEQSCRKYQSVIMDP